MINVFNLDSFCFVLFVLTCFVSDCFEIIHISRCVIYGSNSIERFRNDLENIDKCYPFLPSVKDLKILGMYCPRRCLQWSNSGCSNATYFVWVHVSRRIKSKKNANVFDAKNAVVVTVQNIIAILCCLFSVLCCLQLINIVDS